MHTVRLFMLVCLPLISPLLSSYPMHVACNPSFCVRTPLRRKERAGEEGTCCTEEEEQRGGGTYSTRRRGETIVIGGKNEGGRGTARAKNIAGV